MRENRLLYLVRKEVGPKWKYNRIRRNVHALRGSGSATCHYCSSSILFTFFCSHKIHKIENNLTFGILKKKIWANFQRIIEHFTQKIVSKLSKIWVWDPGSEIRDPEKTHSGPR